MILVFLYFAITACFVITCEIVVHPPFENEKKIDKLVLIQIQYDFIVVIALGNGSYNARLFVVTTGLGSPTQHT